MCKSKSEDKTIQWIVCPLCGARLMKAMTANIEIRCECGAMVAACASKNFVATIVTDKDAGTSMFDRLERYRQEMIRLEHC